MWYQLPIINKGLQQKKTWSNFFKLPILSHNKTKQAIVAKSLWQQACNYGWDYAAGN